MNKEQKQFLSTVEVAKLLNISRIAVFKRIQKGELKAKKMGRNYFVHRDDLPKNFRLKGVVVSEAEKREIKRIVKEAVREYSQTFKLLGKE